VYFYTEERAAEQTVPGHGTYYVPRPLPKGMAPGATLTQEHFWEVEDLIRRRDRQLQFYWQRERELKDELDKLEEGTHPYQQELQRLRNREVELVEQLRQAAQSPSLRLGRFMTWPLRMLRGLFGRA
jgi:chromosome segregation ATPase